MKNYEKYAEEIKKVLVSERHICDFRRNFILKSSQYNCNEIKCTRCREIAKDWLEQDDTEKIKLSKIERAILEEVCSHWKYIARDEDGDMFLFETKPYKIDDIWLCDNNGEQCIDFKLFNHLFKFVKWEDTEPYSIEYILKNCEIKEED